jgi:Calx-beta domain
MGRISGRGARAFARVAVVVALVGGPALAIAPPARADTVGSNFDALTLGSINGQDGWSNPGGAHNPYDQEVALNSGFPNAPASFGTKSFRMSNAVTDGSFANWAFSKKTVDEAGEPAAAAGPFLSGNRQPSYTGQFSFAPTVSTPQAGLSMTVSPDRGDGGRMSWVQVTDTGAPGGLNLNFYDYQDVAPFGSVGTPSDGCSGLDGYQLSTIATGISRTAAHTVELVMAFVPGQHNDVVKVYLDGVLKHTGTSWEDAARFCDGASLTTKTVRSLLFQARTGQGTAPATDGQGFLIDGVSSTTGPIPLPALAIGNVSVVEGQSGTSTANVPVTLSTTYPYPVTVQYFTENGAARAPQDYTAKFGTFTIPANVTSANFPVTIVGDTTLEKNEAFKVKLLNSTNATIMTPTGTLIGRVTILNDELPPVVVKAATAKEGTTSVVKISLKRPYAYPLNLTVQTVNDTAKAPGDFTAVSTVVAFAAQALGPKTVAVFPKRDGLKEPLESYKVLVSGGAAPVSDLGKIPGNKT